MSANSKNDVAKKIKKIVSKKLAKIEYSPNFTITPIDDTFTVLIALLTPTTGFHKGQRYVIRIETSTKAGIFPFHPPKVKFLSKVYHSNVYGCGDICLDILKDKWSPAYNFDSILNSILVLLDDPNPNSAANGVAGKQEKEFGELFRATDKHGMTVEQIDALKYDIFMPYIAEILNNEEHNQQVYEDNMRYFSA